MLLLDLRELCQDASGKVQGAKPGWWKGGKVKSNLLGLRWRESLSDVIEMT